MPGTTPPTSQLEWLSSTTAMIVPFWSRATRDLLKSLGWGIAALLRENAATKLPFHRRPPPSVFRSLSCDQYLNGLKKVPELCAQGQPRCVRPREMLGRSRYL